jgi:tetratricopeptide (TPR) repeat protein
VPAPAPEPSTAEGGGSREDGVILAAHLFPVMGAPGAEPSPREAEHYTVGPEIARGGMGRIVEAFDRRHQRRVALKLLLRNTPEAIRRFEREVQLTARLAHPSIVTLFDAGRWADGSPFFAMKLVEGRSLSTALASAATLEDKLALLPHLIAATEALAYAHEHRVIHRDLKPANVLVGAFGETVVIDWGLAKDLVDGEPDASPVPWCAPEEESETSALTTVGRALGTPCYMPPEQAQGGRADERSDVYALGAILYHVLAGAPPYAAPSAKETLDLVLAGPPLPLDTRTAGLPVDLVAIVRKAMARAPDERYPTAKAMANDLRRFAAGQLVAAHTYSTLALLRRWVARHRLVLSFAAVLLASLLVVGAISVRRIVRERQRADAARASAETQRLAAEDLVGFVLGTLRERLEPLGKLELMSGVGTEVQDYYRRVGAADDGLDVAGLNGRAAAFETLANVEYEKRNMPGAVALWTTATAWRERARKASDEGDTARIKLVADEVRLADVAAMDAHFDEANADLAKARALCDEALARSAAAALLLAEADLDGEAAMIARLQGHTPESDRLADHAVSVAEKVASNRPDDEDAQWALERALFDRGYSAYVAKKNELAARDLTIGTGILQRLLTRTPGNTKRLRALGWSASVLSYAETELRHMDAAEKAARATLDVRVKLAAVDPTNQQARREVMASELSVCQIEIDLGRYDDAAADCRRGREEAERLYEETHQSHQAANDLVVVRDNLGFAHLYAGRPAEAHAELVKAVALASERANREPNTESWTTLHGAAYALGQADLALRDFDRAEADYETSADAAKRADGEGSSGSYVARAAQLGAQIAAARGDLSEAEKRFRAALPLAEAAHTRASSDVESLVRAAEVALGLARTLERAHGASTETRELDGRGRALIAPLKTAGELRPNELAELRALGVQ